MKVIAKFTLNTQDIIDLTDYGHEEDKTWDELTADEKNYILDSIRMEKIPAVDVYDPES